MVLLLNYLSTPPTPQLFIMDHLKHLRKGEHGK